MKRLVRLFGYFLLGIVVFIVVCLAPLIGFVTECRPFARTQESATPSQVRSAQMPYQRPEEQAYLTVPEWYIVFSAEEYATFIADRNPSGFPHLRAIGQYWRAYYQMCRETRDDYAFNSRYHTILTVIGVSFMAENLARGGYENTIGRVAEWTRRGQTEEERYAAQVAAEYGQFLYRIPWFEFPFAEKLEGLWTQTSRWGRYPIRKWERKLALSAEYGVKARYGALIGEQIEDPYSFLKEETVVELAAFEPSALQAIEHARLLETEEGSGELIAIPREHFTAAAVDLVAAGVTFRKISGNRRIVVSLVAPAGWHAASAESEEILSMPVLPAPAMRRVVLALPVERLHNLLTELHDNDIELERIFDY